MVQAELEKTLEIARNHFNWGLNDPFEQLSPRQQKLLSFYIESNLRATPEGFMTVAQVCITLGFSEKTWYNYKKKFNLTPVKVGNVTFYKKEDIDRIANERRQKASDRIAARSERNPKFDKDFEEILEGSKEQDSHDLDLFDLHLEEVGQIPMEIKNHYKWSAKILISQMTAGMLPEILKHRDLTPQQKKQILATLENGVVKMALEEFQNRLNKILSKKMLDRIIQKISNKQKLDNTDEFFINSVQNHANWILDRLSDISRIVNPKERGSELQKLIDRQIYLINEGVSARNKLTEASLRLVISIAKKYTWSGFTIPELESYGCEGLMKAAVKFDWRLGNRFSTYATWWIRQSIGRAIEDYAYAIRVPIHMHERISKFKKEAEKLQQETGEDVDMEDLANEVDPTGNLTKSLRTRNLVSLNSAVGPNQDSFLEDFLADVKDNIEDNSDKIGLREAVREVLGSLSHRERRVLELRYGLEDGRSKPLDQVAVCLANEGFSRLTRERIRQIESKALRKLGHPSRAKKLRPYFDNDPRSIRISPGQAADSKRRSKNDHFST